MSVASNVRISSAIFLASVLAGCGGSGSSTPQTTSTPPTPADTGGISRNGIAIGPISTFGSVVVNGVRYETNNETVFDIDGDESGSQSDLQVGDTVTVIATLDEDSGAATATRITYSDIVTGPVGSVDPASNTLIVLDQVIQVTGDTSFDDAFAEAELTAVDVGQILEVSGSIDSDGRVVATRIELKAAGADFEVTGTVANLDNAAQTFMIGDLLVDFSSAMLTDFPNGVVNNGDFVEVTAAQIGFNDELIASEVGLESLLPDIGEDDFAEIEGLVTRFVSASDFDVSNFPVVTNAQTEFEGGTAADIAPNVKVEVEGDIDANGVLVAREIEIRGERSVRISAAVDSVNATNQSLVALGITVTIDTLTRLEDKTDADVDPLTLADISVGDFVEIRGDEISAGSGTVLAALFERDDADDTEIRGVVESNTDPAFEILGVTIETDPDTEFFDLNDNPISRAEFFGVLANGDLVDVSGMESSATTILADEVEIESPD